jgi:hypothetical protein
VDVNGHHLEGQFVVKYREHNPPVHLRMSAVCGSDAGTDNHIQLSLKQTVVTWTIKALTVRDSKYDYSLT